MIHAAEQEMTPAQESLAERVGKKEKTIHTLETWLATGYPRRRLEVISGLKSEQFDTLLSDEPAWNDYLAHSNAIDALALWFEEEESARNATANAFADTPTFLAIQGAIERARQGNKLIAITGGVGVGKSEAAKAYAAANPRTRSQPGAMRIEFKQSDRNSAAALGKILSLMAGERGGAYRTATLLDEIGKSYRPGDILILDECNELGDAAGIIRDLRDSFNLPIVAMGNQQFDRSIYGKRSTFDALASRMLRYDFPVTTEDDVDAWLAWEGISGARMRKAAISIAARPGPYGGLRSLALLIKECREYGRPLDAEMLIEVARQMGRPIRPKEAA